MPSTSFYNGKRQFNRLVNTDASGDETVKLIIKTINEDAVKPFVKETVQLIQAKAPDRISFLKHLFAVACKSVKYLADEPGHEVVYTSPLLIRMGKGDCKKFTTFIGAVLKAAGYDGVPKVVKYRNDMDWQHIYIISRDPMNPSSYITMDPVNHCKYDKEVRYSQARLNYLDGTYSPIIMGNKLSLMGNLGDSDFMSGVNDSAASLLDNLQGASGIGCNRRSRHTMAGLAAIEEDYINGINDENQIYGDEDGISGISDIGRKKAAKSGSKRPVKTKKSKAEKKEKRKKFFHKLKKVGPAMLATRLAFLSLVKMAGALQKTKLKINLAKKLAEAMQDPERAKPVLDIWYKFGGEKDALMKAIIQAGKSKMHGIGEPDQMFMDGLAGLGVAPAVAAAAVITAASPILIAVTKLLKKSGKVDQGAADAIEEGVEAAEGVAMDVNAKGQLTPSAALTLTRSKLMKSALEDDRGGNQDTTREIQAEAAQQDEDGNFKGGARSGSNAAPKVDTTNEETPTPTGRHAMQPIDAGLMPVPLKDTPQALGKTCISFSNPAGWLKLTLAVSVTCTMIHLPDTLTKALTTITFSVAIVMITKLFLKPKHRYNGKR